MTPRRLVEVLQALLDHLPLMVAVWGPDGRLALINPALERTLGWSLRDYLEREAFSACYPDPLARQEVLAAIASGFDGWREFRVRTRWGHDLATRWLVLRLPSGLRVCIGEDVSRQREAEERLREQAALLDSAHDAIIVCDLEDHILSWNRGAERLYGWSAVEVLGLRTGDVLGSPRRGRDSGATPELLECGEWRGELGHVTRGGTPIIVDSSQTLLRDANGRPRARLAINTDVTEKKRLEAQALEAQRLDSVGRLAGGLAHELNNILTPLRLGLDCLLGGEVDAEQRPLLEMMLAGVQRGAAVVQGVLAFARGGVRRPVDPAPPPEAGRITPGQGECLLVVEDEPSIRELARAVLETFGYAVVTAGDGREALEVFRVHAGRVRLALVDMVMPLLDGPATIHGLRALDANLPVIIASGLDSPLPSGAGSLRVQGFLRKPYSAQALLDAVRKVLGATAS